MTRKTILALSLMGFICGIAIAEVHQLLEIKLLPISYLCLISLIPILISPLIKKIKLLEILVISIFIFFGIIRSVSSIHIPNESDIDFYAKEHDVNEAIIFEGIICNLPDVREKNTKLTICTEKIFIENSWKNVSGKVLANVPRFPEIHYGDRIKINGALEIPGEFNGFSYKNYLAKDGIFSFMPNASAEIISSDNGNKLVSLLFKLKLAFEENLSKTIPDPESGFAAGILLGSRKQMPERVLENFRTTGLLHLLALSGFNITILIIAIFWCFKKFPKKMRIIATVIIITFFVIMVGSGASIIRAAIMGIIGLLILHSGRQTHPAILLLIASALMILWNPKILLFDVSFQLSVAGVIGLIFFVPILENFQFIKNLPKTMALKDALLVTLSAQIVVAPLAAFHFGTYSVVSPIANPLVAPLIPIGMLISFIVGVAGFISIEIAKIFGFFAYLILHIGLKIAEIFAKIPYAQVKLEIGIIIFILWYLVIGGCYYFLKSRLLSCHSRQP